jgi:hypothetical protein
MAETEKASLQTGFVRQSDTESICTSCSHSIRTERSTVLKVAEDIHADVCLARPDSQLQDFLL